MYKGSQQKVRGTNTVQLMNLCVESVETEEETCSSGKSSTTRLFEGGFPFLHVTKYLHNVVKTHFQYTVPLYLEFTTLVS